MIITKKLFHKDYFFFLLKNALTYSLKTSLHTSFDIYGKAVLFVYYKNNSNYFLFNFFFKSSFFRFKSCSEFTVIDFLSKKYRYVLIYFLLSYVFNNRLLIKFKYSSKNRLNSLTILFKSLE